MKVKINTHGNALPEVHGEWIDLCTAEDVTLDFLEYKNILKEEYINDLAEFQALCMEQFYKDKERREAVIEEAEDDAEDAGQIGMEDVQE